MSLRKSLGVLMMSRRFIHNTHQLHRPTVPIIFEKKGLSEMPYDIYSRLLKDRIVCVMGPISDELSAAVIAQMLYLDSDSDKPIHMYINSPGGSVTAGLGIYDTMQYIQAPVATFCLGQAASMGSLLLCAGTNGMRHALPNAVIMMHQPSGQTSGFVTDIAIHAEYYLNIKKKMNGLYATHTKMDLETIEKNLERDKFLSATEAQELGLIDSILERSKGTEENKDSSS